MEATLIVPDLPPHVPPELVRDYPFLLGRIATENPFKRMVQSIHEEPPIFFVPNLYPGNRPAWVVRRMADLRAIYNDNVHFSARNFAPFAQLVGEDWDLLLNGNDPPEHALYRQMVAPFFSPKAVRELDKKIVQRAEYFVGTLDGGAAEYREAFAVPFPVSIVIDLLGLSQDRLGEFMEWETGLLHSPDIAVIAQSTRNVTAMFREEIRSRRANPKDDIISFALQTEIDGRRMTDDEVLGLCFNLFAGGLDTVTTNLTLQTRHLAENPQDQALLRAEPKRIPLAVEEMLRAYGPVTTFRTCIKPVTVNGVRFEVGDKIAMATTLANHDPAAFDNPEEVQLNRREAHFAFGHGIHLCLGQFLARRELHVAMDRLLKHLPPFRIPPGVEIQTHVGLVIQPLSLPIIWNSK